MISIARPTRARLLASETGTSKCVSRSCSAAARVFRSRRHHRMDFFIKPRPEAYQIALKISGEQDPAQCILFDDLVPNLLGAKEQGFTTVLVGVNGGADSADFQLPSIHKIKEFLPHLWSKS